MRRCQGRGGSARSITGCRRTSSALSYETGRYLAFLGRISPEKRADRAIEVAHQTGLPLKIGAKVDDVDRDYFTQHIEPLLEADHVEFVGEVAGQDKADRSPTCRRPRLPHRLGGAVRSRDDRGDGLWHPGDREPHWVGPEVVDDRVSGFIARSTKQAVDAVRRVGELSREQVRASFERRFTVERMTRNYVDIYERLIADGMAAGEPASFGVAEPAMPEAIEAEVAEV